MAGCGERVHEHNHDNEPDEHRESERTNGHRMKLAERTTGRIVDRE